MTEKPQYPEANYPFQEITDAIIAAGIAVHNELGPGFVESIYENALVAELLSQGRKVGRQQAFRVYYKGQEVGLHRLDLIVDNEVIMELKSVEAVGQVHEAQLRSTLKAAGKRVGLLINFNHPMLTKGIRRVIC